MSLNQLSTKHDEALQAQYGDSSLPPNVLPCERAALGGALLHGLDCLHPLRSDDFYSPKHQALFDLLVDMYTAHPGGYLDPVAVKDEMFRRGRPLEATPMVLMYDEAIGMAVNPVSVRYHIERILETAELRAKQALGQRLAQVAGNPEAAAAALADYQRVADDYRIRLAGSEMRGTSLADHAREARLAAATSPPAMSTGLLDLDRALSGGLRPSTFNVLGARPGAGKSLLAGTVALHLGSTHMARVLYVTMELSAREVTNRMLSSIGGIDLTKLQNRHLLTDPDLIALDDAEEKLRDWPIDIVEGGRAIEDIESLARDYLGAAPAGLLVVDFLQRIKEDGASTASRERHVGMCSSRLTDLSRELRIPVLCVVSFNRDSARRQNAPRMDDIRDSGTIESDADTTMLLWQPDPNAADEIQMVIDKNRYGQVCTVPLRRQGSRGRFVSSARDGWGTAA